MTLEHPRSDDTCVITPSISPQVTASQHDPMTHDDAFPTYRRNRAQAHTHTQQPIWQDASHASSVIPAKIDNRGSSGAKIPAWLRRHLKETGVTTQGFTRRMRAISCPACRQTVVKGWTDEPCAILAIADPAPLSNVGEALALLQGRMTFDIARRGGRYELDLREEDHIHGSPAETPDSWRRNGDVLAQHRCGTPPLPTIESRLNR